MKVNHRHRAKTKLQSLLFSIEDTRQWIIQADAKGGFLLTINGVIAGFMLQQIVLWIKSMNAPGVSLSSHIVLLAGFALYLWFQSLSLWHTVQVFVPRTPASEPEQTQRTRHVFNYSLHRHFPTFQDFDRLVDEYTALSLPELEDEFVARLQVDALVCSAKYESFGKAFRMLLWALGFALLGFFGVQFWVG